MCCRSIHNIPPERMVVIRLCHGVLARCLTSGPPLDAQDVVRVLGLPAGVTIGAFDALAAFNSPNATTAAVGRAVYTVEASLTNIVALGAWLLYGNSNDLTKLGVVMYAVRPQNHILLLNTLTEVATARSCAIMMDDRAQGAISFVHPASTFVLCKDGEHMCRPAGSLSSTPMRQPVCVSPCTRGLRRASRSRYRRQRRGQAGGCSRRRC